MKDPLSSLPDDLEALKAFAMAEKAAHADRLEAEVAALKAQNMDVETRLARLTSLLKSLEHARHGKRSEKLGPDAAEQKNFVFEEIETGIAEVKASLDKASGVAERMAAVEMTKSVASVSSKQHVSVVADRGFVKDLRELGATPHIAQNTAGR